MKHLLRSQELRKLDAISTTTSAPCNSQVHEELTTESIQDQILRHIDRVGPLTLNVLRASYMKEYDGSLLERHLRELVDKKVLPAVRTSHSVRYSRSADAN